MHTGKRTRNIRLKELKTIYWERLRAKSFARMDEALQNRTVLPRELEQEIWDYYRRTVPSLQEFYSRILRNGKCSSSRSPCHRFTFWLF